LPFAFLFTQLSTTTSELSHPYSCSVCNLPFSFLFSVSEFFFPERQQHQSTSGEQLSFIIIFIPKVTLFMNGVFNIANDLPLIKYINQVVVESS
jgi:hypothetical protein